MSHAVETLYTRSLQSFGSLLKTGAFNPDLVLYQIHLIRYKKMFHLQPLPNRHLVKIKNQINYHPEIIYSFFLFPVKRSLFPLFRRCLIFIDFPISESPHLRISPSPNLRISPSPHLITPILPDMILYAIGWPSLSGAMISLWVWVSSCFTIVFFFKISAKPLYFTWL